MTASVPPGSNRNSGVIPLLQKREHPIVRIVCRTRNPASRRSEDFASEPTFSPPVGVRHGRRLGLSRRSTLAQNRQLGKTSGSFGSTPMCEQPPIKGTMRGPRKQDHASACMLRASRRSGSSNSPLDQSVIGRRSMPKAGRQRAAHSVRRRFRHGRRRVSRKAAR